jgi:hypothetical protein
VRLRRVAPSHQQDARFGWPTRRQLVAGAGYAAATALFVTIGIVVNDFMLSVFEGIGFLLVVAWLLPAAVRRFVR